MAELSYVWADLTAWHTDPHMGEGRHQHTWRVTAYFPARPFRDGRVLKAALVTVLGAWQDADLPPQLWAAEELAVAIWRLLGNCCGVRIERDEGFGAAVGICA